MTGLLAHADPAIAKVASEVRRLTLADNTGHDWGHVVRVARLAERLADMEDADGTVVMLGALLHDVDDRKMTGDPATEAGLPNARSIMTLAGIGSADASIVCSAIEGTGFRKSLLNGPPEGREARILSDADQLDAVGAFGIARAFAYGATRGRPMFDPDVFPRTDFTPEQYDSELGTTINHFFEKLLRIRGRMLTEAGQWEAHDRHLVMVSFLDEFLEEADAPEEWLDLLNRYRPGSVLEAPWRATAPESFGG